MPTLGERLKELRASKKLTQRELSALLGITDRTYQYYEADKTVPPLSSLELLADMYDVSLDQLTGKEKKHSLVRMTDALPPELSESKLSIPTPTTQKTDPVSGDLVFEYERNGERAVLHFPPGTSNSEIEERVKLCLRLLGWSNRTSKPNSSSLST
jgi:transcriptional regulator with XRE-family HTH domain